MFHTFKQLLGLAKDAGIGPPTGKMGFQKTTDDYAHLDSRLATEGAIEFVDFCILKGDCQLEGETTEKFREVLAKYPASDDEEYDLLGVVVRDKLTSAGLLPIGDPERYQYKIAMWGQSLATHDREQAS
ncbi:hypothetical protein LOC67_26925 [Stieleria sp. JC731]|uniref:hypothetical protein n=1 Tax=Stieleria sp. JC731 TaxID=2894195 RepID=UPI001E3BF44A|nr:hypothetical protein [Stieleria sp. JC731]MCC9604204.1 hypothetical protein [Stieleria sp. JC731]